MHGSNGVEDATEPNRMVDNEKPLTVNGGGTARTETFDGGIGRSVYDGVEHMDAQGEQEGIQAYKTIRTGVDEMNFVMLEDVNQPIETGTVLVSRGGYWYKSRRSNRQQNNEWRYG